MSAYIAALVQDLKDKGEWTECHEKGCDLPEDPEQQLECSRCGANYEDVVEAITKPREGIK